MGATPDPAPTDEPTVGLYTYVQARFADHREYIDERFKGLEERLKHSDQLRRREHQELLTAFSTMHDGLGDLRARHDEEIDKLDDRVDALESDRDKRAGGSTRIRDLLVLGAALVGMAGGLHII